MPTRPRGPGKTRPRPVYADVRNYRLTLWCGPAYMPIRLLAARKWVNGTLVLVEERQEVIGMPRALDPVTANGIVLARSKPKLLEKFPELCSWLCDGAYSDGKPVGVVQLSIRPKGAVFCCTLRVQDLGGMMVQAEDVNLDDGLLLLEAALCAVPVPWSRDPYPLGQVTGKRK